MDKELYLKIRKNQKKIYFLENKINQLEGFLKQYERLYETEESIEAIKRIKEYIKEKKEKLKIIYSEQQELDIKMRTTCEHDILINISDEFPNHQRCLICGTRSIDWKGQDEKTKVFIKNFHAYNGTWYFDEKFDEIVSKGLDPYESFIDLVKEKGGKGVRILRR